MRLRIAGDLLEVLEAEVRAAHPLECCGLLEGLDEDAETVRVTAVHPAPNVTQETAADRFELDPTVRIRLEVALRGTARRIVGHYHSHPGGSSEPSAVDRARAYEPELVWVIVGADGVKAWRIGAAVEEVDVVGWFDHPTPRDS